MYLLQDQINMAEVKYPLDHFKVRKGNSWYDFNHEITIEVLVVIK